MKWISVEDRLPDGKVLVAVYTRTSDLRKAWYVASHGAWHLQIGRTAIVIDSVTHWMPLPEPPVDKDGG